MLEHVTNLHQGAEGGIVDYRFYSLGGDTCFNCPVVRFSSIALFVFKLLQTVIL